jgi:hypothetical protein
VGSGGIIMSFDATTWHRMTDRTAASMRRSRVAESRQTDRACIARQFAAMLLDLPLHLRSGLVGHRIVLMA